jgi:[glutamine synthetase] adenylyltransferase / [glutamine synthetase]-adenylyl-L-tyrosine phosphorylase
MIAIASEHHEELPLWRRISSAPQLIHARRAESRLVEFLATTKGAALHSLADESCVRALLLALAIHSPFLWRLATAHASRLKRCLEMPPERCLDACLATLNVCCAVAQTDAEVMRALRLAKQETALLIGLADLGGAFDVIAATEALSRAADAFISAALRHVLREAARAGRLRLTDGPDIETGCGLVILALGKLGARELNYSSDVDIVVFFDPECGSLTGAVDPATLFARLTKDLVRLLQERTADGYVARVDLRLRPDPGSRGGAILGAPPQYKK